MPAIRGSSRIFPVGAASSITGPAGHIGPTGGTGATGPTGGTGPVGVMGTYIVATGASGGPGNSYGNDFITFYLTDGTTIGVSGAAGNPGDSQSSNNYYTIVNASELIEHSQLFREMDGATAFFNTITVSGNDITARYDGDTIIFTGNTYDFGVLGITGELAVGPSADGAKNTHYDGNTLLMRILNHREIYDGNNINTPSGTNIPSAGGAGATGGNTYGTSFPFINIVNERDLPEGVLLPGATAMYSGIHAGQITESDDSLTDVYYGFPGVTFSDVTNTIGLGNDPFGSCCYCQDVGSEEIDSYNCLNYVTEDYCDSVRGVYSIASCLDRPEGPNCNSGGACCVNGTCVAGNEDRCKEFGGFYVGDMTCAEIYGIGGCPNSCGYSGVCCVLGQCYDTDPLGCDYLGGNWSVGSCNTDGEICCDQTLQGACCLEEICYDTSPATCAAIIEDDTDTSALGACCFSVDDDNVPVMVFSYDESQSMTGQEEVIKTFTQNVIAGIQSNNVDIPIGVTIWSTTVDDILSPPVPYSNHQEVIDFVNQEYAPSGSTRYIPAFVENDNIIRDYINSNSEGDGPCFDGEWCPEASNAIVVFLSDGVPYGDVDEVYAILNNYNSPDFPLGKYITIGYGLNEGEDGDEARNLLQLLASKTQGIYFEAPDAAGLEEIIAIISGVAGFCEQKTWFDCQRTRWYKGQECSETVCEQSPPATRGACCRLGNVCDDVGIDGVQGVPQNECSGVGDVWYGPGTDCGSILCGSYAGGGSSRGVFWGVGSYCAGPEGPYEWNWDPLQRSGWLQFDPGSEYDICSIPNIHCPCECDRPGVYATVSGGNPFGGGSSNGNSEEDPITFRQGDQGHIVCRCRDFTCQGSYYQDGHVVLCPGTPCNSTGECDQPDQGEGGPGGGCDGPVGGWCQPGCLIGGNGCYCNECGCDCCGGCWMCDGGCTDPGDPSDCPPGFPGGGSGCPGCDACLVGDLQNCGEAVNCCMNGDCDSCGSNGCCVDDVGGNSRPCGGPGDWCVEGTCNPGLCCNGIGDGGGAWGTPGQCGSCGCPDEAEGSCWEEHVPEPGCCHDPEPECSETCCEAVCAEWPHCCVSQLMEDEDGNLLGPGWDAVCVEEACTLGFGVGCRECCINEHCPDDFQCINYTCVPCCLPSDPCCDGYPTDCSCPNACCYECVGSIGCGCTSDDDCDGTNNLCCGSNQTCVDCDGGGGCDNNEDCDDGYRCCDGTCKVRCEEGDPVDPPYTGTNTYPCGTIVLADGTCWSCCYSGELPDRSCAGELGTQCQPCCYGDDSCIELLPENCTETGGTPTGEVGQTCEDVDCTADNLGSCCYRNGSGCAFDQITMVDCYANYGGIEVVKWTDGGVCDDVNGLCGGDEILTGSCCSPFCTAKQTHCDGECTCSGVVVKNACGGDQLWTEGTDCDYCQQGIEVDIGVCCYANGNVPAYTTEEECVGPAWCLNDINGYMSPLQGSGGIAGCDPATSVCCGKRRNKWTDVGDCSDNDGTPPDVTDCGGYGACCYPVSIGLGSYTSSGQTMEFVPIACKLADDENDCSLSVVNTHCPSDETSCQSLATWWPASGGAPMIPVEDGGLWQYTKTFLGEGTNCAPATPEDCAANYYDCTLPDDEPNEWNADCGDSNLCGSSADQMEYYTCLNIGASICEQKGTCCRNYGPEPDATTDPGWWQRSLTLFDCDEEENENAPCCMSRDNRWVLWANACGTHGGWGRACSGFANTTYGYGGDEDDCDTWGCGDNILRVPCCIRDTAEWSDDEHTDWQCEAAGGDVDITSGNCVFVECCEDGSSETGILRYECDGTEIDGLADPPTGYTREQYYCELITCCTDINTCLSDVTRKTCFTSPNNGDEITNCSNQCDLKGCCESGQCSESTNENCGGTSYASQQSCIDEGGCEAVNCCNPVGGGLNCTDYTQNGGDPNGAGPACPDNILTECDQSNCNDNTRICCTYDGAWECSESEVINCNELIGTNGITEVRDATSCNDCVEVNCCDDVNKGDCTPQIPRIDCPTGTEVGDCEQNCGTISCCVNGVVSDTTIANCTGLILEDQDDPPIVDGNGNPGSWSKQEYYCDIIDCCMNRGCGTSGNSCDSCGADHPEAKVTREECFATPMTHHGAGIAPPNDCEDCADENPDCCVEGCGSSTNSCSNAVQVICTTGQIVGGDDDANPNEDAVPCTIGQPLFGIESNCNYETDEFDGCYNLGCCVDGECKSMHPNDCRLNGGDSYNTVDACNAADNCAYVDCCFDEQGVCYSAGIDLNDDGEYYTEATCADDDGTVEDCSTCDNTSVTCCEDPETETCSAGVTETYCNNAGVEFTGNCSECRYVGCCTGGDTIPFDGCVKTVAYNCDTSGDDSIIYDPGAGQWDDDDFDNACANQCTAVNCCIEGLGENDEDNVCYPDDGTQGVYFSNSTCTSGLDYERNVVANCNDCVFRECCVTTDSCNHECDVELGLKTEAECNALDGEWNQDNDTDFCTDCYGAGSDCRDCCIPNVECHRGVDQLTCDILAGASDHTWDVGVCNTCNTDPLGCCCMEESDLIERPIGTCHVLIQSVCAGLDNDDTVETTWSDTNYSGGVCNCPDCARRKCCYLVGDTNEEVAHCVDMTPSECDAENGELSDYGSGQHPNDSFCAACTAPDLVGTCCYFWPPDGHGFRDCGVVDGGHCDPEQVCTNSIECNNGKGGCFCDGGKCTSVLDAVCPCGGSDCFGCLETCCAPDLMTQEECNSWWDCGAPCDPTGNIMPGTSPGVRWNEATSPDCSHCSFNDEFGSCCVGNVCETKSSGNITEYECEVLHGGDWILDGTCDDCSSCSGGSDQECKVDDDCTGDYAGMGCCCGCCAETCEYDMCGEFGYFDGGGSGTFWVADRWDTDGNQPGNGLGSLIVFNQGTSNIPQVNEFRRHHGRIEWHFLVDLPDFPLDPWNNSNFVGQDSITTDSAWGNYFGTDSKTGDPLYDPASSFGSKITFRVTNNITDTTYTYTSYSSRGWESGDTVWWIATGGSPPRWVCECEGNNCDGYNSNNPAIDSDTLWGEAGGINPSFTVKYEPVVEYARCCVNYGDEGAACVLLSWQQCEDQTGDADTYWDYQCANCVDTKKCCVNNHTVDTYCYNNGQEVPAAFCDSISGGAWMETCNQCVSWTQCCKNHNTVDAECEPSWPENVCLNNAGVWGEFACDDCTPTQTAQCCKEDFTCSTTVLETQADCEGAGGTWGENACTGCKAPPATGYCCLLYGTDFFFCDGSDNYDTRAECEAATGGPIACGGFSCWTEGDGGLCTNCVGSERKQCCLGGPNFPWAECHENMTSGECSDALGDLTIYWSGEGLDTSGWINWILGNGFDWSDNACASCSHQRDCCINQVDTGDFCFASPIYGDFNTCKGCYEIYRDNVNVNDWSWKDGACDIGTACSKCPPGRDSYPYDRVGNDWEQTNNPFTPCCDDDACTDPNEPICGTNNECGPEPPECSNNSECTVQGLTCCVDGACVACCEENSACPAGNTPCCSGSPDFICEACCTSDGDCGTDQCCHLPPKGPEGGQCYSCPGGPCCGSDDPVGLDWDLDPDPQGPFDLLHTFFERVPDCRTHTDDGDPIITEQQCESYCEGLGYVCTGDVPSCTLGGIYNGCHTDNHVWWRTVGGNASTYPESGPKICCCHGQGEADSNRPWISPTNRQAPGPSVESGEATSTACVGAGGTWFPDPPPSAGGTCLKPDASKTSSLNVNSDTTWPVDIDYPNGTCTWVIETILSEEGQGCFCPADGFCGGFESDFCSEGISELIGCQLMPCIWGRFCGWFENSQNPSDYYSCLFPECYEYICEMQEWFDAGQHPWAPPCQFNGAGCCSGGCSGSCGIPCYCVATYNIGLFDAMNWDGDWPCCSGGSYDPGEDDC